MYFVMSPRLQADVEIVVLAQRIFDVKGVVLIDAGARVRLRRHLQEIGN
jgi:hypothetical protein